jgi:hypothetical protein
MADKDVGISAIREELSFQRTSWIVERVAWVLLALVPLAALTGIFAHGFFSDQTIRSNNSALSVEYERFQRQSVQARFVFRIAASGSNDVQLRLNSAFQQTYEIQSLHPAPVRSRADNEGLELFFHRPEGGELVVVLWGTPRSFGRLLLEAHTDSGDQVELPILIYP